MVGVVQAFRYNGFITKITLSTGAEYRYVYDDLGQLLREDNTVTNKTYVYEYDDAGNITSKKTYALTAEGATPSSLVSSVTYGYTDPLGWGDLLTSYGGGSITYDVIGNPLTYYNGNSYTFEWENGRQLAAVSSDDFELEFVYNDEGIRTQKIANGAVHTYHLSGSQIISEEWGNHLLVYLYDSNGSPMGMQYRRSSMAEDVFYTFWFEKNLQGDIVAVYNSAGTKVVSYAYDAWGNCIATNHNISGTNSYANLNPFRYRGYYYDSELGFYYLNSRYYDPSVGRFINADVYVSTGQGLLGYNMFAYCGNNPITRLDSTGNKYSKTELHNFVLENICKHNSDLRCKDTYMKYKTKYLFHSYGYCDLYNTKTGEVWECKRFGGGVTCTKFAASLQLANYVNNGILQCDTGLNLQIGGTETIIETNEFTVPDKDGEGFYSISYWDAEDGIIFYDYCYIPSIRETLGIALVVSGAALCQDLLSGSFRSRVPARVAGYAS